MVQEQRVLCGRLGVLQGTDSATAIWRSSAKAAKAGIHGDAFCLDRSDETGPQLLKLRRVARGRIAVHPPGKLVEH